MKNTKNKILPFPPSKEPTPQTIICQIGSERFAIHIEIEDLPPVKAPMLLKMGIPIESSLRADRERLLPRL